MYKAPVTIKWSGWSSAPDATDHIVVVLPFHKTKAKLEAACQHLPTAVAKGVLALLSAKQLDLSCNSLSVRGWAVGVQLSVVVWDPEAKPFEHLTLAGKLAAALKAAGAKKAFCFLKPCEFYASSWLDALAAALTVHWGALPDYKAKPAKPVERLTLQLEPCEPLTKLKSTVKTSQALAQATNQVRYLAMMPANKLSPKEFSRYAQEQAKQAGLSYHKLTQAQLKKKGAGAFLSVCQGSAHQDAGIVTVSYKAKAPKAHIAVVGKGITYDTGGVCLKPPRYMFGMQQDMAGAAVALSYVLLAAELKLPYSVTAHLGIADNDIGNQAIRPNEVVTSLSGKTIETVHTDAEGRMVLADTLFYAQDTGYDLIIDYATLTGSCVAAIGQTYCGAFSNRPEFFELLRQAGQCSGERCWPFPLDEDFGESLKSDIADTKQCRLTGGVDHIEAAFFLKQFVDAKRPWVHFDLSSSESDGGLAHVPTEATGVGGEVDSCFD